MFKCTTWNRYTAVESVWPTAAAAQSGSLLTLRGWGFAAGQDAGPGQRGAMWPFSDGGTGVDVEGGSGVDGGKCLFTSATIYAP